MRVLCLIEALGPGGAERQMSGLASMLKGEGHEVRVITYYPNDFFRYVLDEAGVEFQYLPAAQGKYKRTPLLAWAIISYHPNAVIAYSPSAAEIACLLKMIGFRFRLIVSERNTSQSNSRREKTKFFFYRWADSVVSNSHTQTRFIEEYYPHLLPKTEVITNFVDTDYFSPAETPGYGDGVCRMICVGRDHPQKNILRFIDAIKKLISDGLALKVDWYGHFETSYGQKCKEKIQALELGDYFTFKGETTNIRDEYRKHDIFCLPSIYEGFPNVLNEAMSCGLPVVCSKVCDNPLIVKEGVNGLLFNPLDIDDMASRIRDVVRMDEGEKAKMRDANRKRAVEMFSKRVFLDHYMSLMEI